MVEDGYCTEEMGGNGMGCMGGYGGGCGGRGGYGCGGYNGGGYGGYGGCGGGGGYGGMGGGGYGSSGVSLSETNGTRNLYILFHLYLCLFLTIDQAGEAGHCSQENIIKVFKPIPL